MAMMKGKTESRKKGWGLRNIPENICLQREIYLIRVNINTNHQRLEYYLITKRTKRKEQFKIKFKHNPEVDNF